MSQQNKWVDLLLAWYEHEKRDLPWRRTSDPYAIWISEIMLQQTRVEAVIGYFHRFLQSFPTVHALAKAPQEAVLKAWEGLGYYSRARNLHKAAQIVSNEYNGKFPNNFHDLKQLPGIGDYTAGAIASIAFGQAVPAIDGNVKRVISRILGIRENVNQPAVLRSIHDMLIQAIPASHASSFNQALMELGAMICIPRSPRCDTCPLISSCDAYEAGDAENLPVMDSKKPPRVMEIAVCLLTYQNHILLFQRQERLLHNLYVFGLVEDAADPQQAKTYWESKNLRLRFQTDLGDAKHVFTHRIWNMKLYHFELLKAPDPAFLLEQHAMLANRDQIKTLPLPTAMKAAKEAVLTIV